MARSTAPLMTGETELIHYRFFQLSCLISVAPFIDDRIQGSRIHMQGINCRRRYVVMALTAGLGAVHTGITEHATVGIIRFSCIRITHVAQLTGNLPVSCFQELFSYKDLFKEIKGGLFYPVPLAFLHIRNFCTIFTKGNGIFGELINTIRVHMAQSTLADFFCNEQAGRENEQQKCDEWEDERALCY